MVPWCGITALRNASAPDGDKLGGSRCGKREKPISISFPAAEITMIRAPQGLPGGSTAALANNKLEALGLEDYAPRFVRNLGALLNRRRGPNDSGLEQAADLQ